MYFKIPLIALRECGKGSVLTNRYLLFGGLKRHFVRVQIRGRQGRYAPHGFQPRGGRNVQGQRGRDGIQYHRQHTRAHVESGGQSLHGGLKEAETQHAMESSATDEGYACGETENPIEIQENRDGMGHLDAAQDECPFQKIRGPVEWGLDDEPQSLATRDLHS